MAIEIVSFPMKNCDFPVRYVKLPEGNWDEPPNDFLRGTMFSVKPIWPNKNTNIRVDGW